MNRCGKLSVCVGVLAVAVAGPSHAQYTFTTIDYPDAVSTLVNNLDINGRLVGEYVDSADETHAFVLTDGDFVSFDAPGSTGYTSANGINAAGQIIGLYADSESIGRTYLRNGDTYTDLIPFAGSAFTVPGAINDQGTVVGAYANAVGSFRGFMYNGATYTTLNRPGASETSAIGINNAGIIVGTYVAAFQRHGFRLSGTQYTTLDYPGAVFTVAQGINDSDQIAGLYQDLGGMIHGFVRTAGVYATVDPPGATLTQIFAINNAGQVAGYFEDDFGVHGFLATPMTALGADFNGDGAVDGDDLTAWTGNFGLGTDVMKKQGDADGDGDVDGADFLKWQQQLVPLAAAARARTGRMGSGGGRRSQRIGLPKTIVGQATVGVTVPPRPTRRHS